MSWLNVQLDVCSLTLTPLTGDAGFRHYYRIQGDTEQSLLAIDSPNDKCNNQGYYQINLALEQQNIKVPHIHAVDWQQGFFCIEDLGNCLLSDKLTPTTVTEYYQQALNIIPNMFDIKKVDNYELPSYDSAFVQQELNIFTEWLVEQYLSINLTEQEQQIIADCFELLVQNVSEQPQAFMHRDFHSRNLMIIEDENLAVIDYQDAVLGPITYDAVSLLKDCYVKWPTSTVEQLFDYFINLIEAKYPQWQFSRSTWLRWFDLMGMQRHFKAAGIFARLHLRDGKNGYLKDIPLTLSYIVELGERYPEFNQVAELINAKILPALKGKN